MLGRLPPATEEVSGAAPQVLLQVLLLVITHQTGTGDGGSPGFRQQPRDEVQKLSRNRNRIRFRGGKRKEYILK